MTDAPIPLAEALARFEPTSDPPPRPDTDCARCQARWPRPGRCDWCSSRIPPEPPPAARVEGLARTIPEAFREVSWANVERLRNDAGTPRVRLEPGHTMPRVRAAMSAHRRVVLLGPAGSGKTTLAGAWARAAIAAGVDRVRWFTSLELLENEPRESSQPGRQVLPMDLALSAGALVVDDLGAELEGAQPRTGLLAQRVGACSRVIGARFDRQRPTLVTTGFQLDGPSDAPGIRQLYGDRVARRIFEAAAVVRLGGG